MVTRLVDFAIGDGSTQKIRIEVEEIASGNMPVAREGVVAQATRSFEDVIDQIRPAVDAVAESLRKLTVQPDQTVVELGVKISAGADAWIAKTAIEGNLKISFTFKSNQEVVDKKS